MSENGIAKTVISSNHMPITIPKKFISPREDLIIVPRSEYENLLERAVPMARLTRLEKRELETARREMARGEFLTLKEFEHELDRSHTKKGVKVAR